MTRSIRGSRRAALLLAGTAAAASLLLSGCGAGQISETAKKIPSVQGINVQTPDNLYAVRGLYVQYPGPEGYHAGGNAALNMVIYNDSRSPVTVTVTTESARDVVLAGGVPSGAQASPSESATEPMSASPSPTEPSGSASPSALLPAPANPSASESAAPTEPARIEIPALGYAQLNSNAGRFLQLVGLNEDLLSGQQVVLTFDFGNGKTIKTPAPVGVPLTPAAIPSPIIHPREEAGTEGGHG